MDQYLRPWLWKCAVERVKRLQIGQAGDVEQDRDRGVGGLRVVRKEEAIY